MQYIDFVKNLADDLQEKFEKRNRDVRVEFRKVEKHWGTELGIEVFEKGCSAPIIYPKDLYDRHEAGEEYFSLLDICVGRIENALDNTPFYGGYDFKSSEYKHNEQDCKSSSCIILI